MIIKRIAYEEIAPNDSDQLWEKIQPYCSRYVTLFGTQEKPEFLDDLLEELNNDFLNYTIRPETEERFWRSFSKTLVTYLRDIQLAIALYKTYTNDSIVSNLLFEIETRTSTSNSTDKGIEDRTIEKRKTVHDDNTITDNGTTSTTGTANVESTGKSNSTTDTENKNAQMPLTSSLTMNDYSNQQGTSKVTGTTNDEATTKNETTTSGTNDNTRTENKTQETTDDDSHHIEHVFDKDGSGMEKIEKTSNVFERINQFYSYIGAPNKTFPRVFGYLFTQIDGDCIFYEEDYLQ